MPRSQGQDAARQARLKLPPCHHGVRGCVGDAYGTEADQPGPICVRHAVENCGAVPAPEGADLDEMFAKDGYEVLSHPCEQPPDWRPEEPLAPGLKKLTEFTAMQLMGNGTGQPGKDAKRNKNYAKVWEVYAFAAIVGYILKSKNKPTKIDQIKPYIDAQWRRMMGAAATEGELDMIREYVPAAVAHTRACTRMPRTVTRPFCHPTRGALAPRAQIRRHGQDGSRQDQRVRPEEAHRHGGGARGQGARVRAGVHAGRRRRGRRGAASAGGRGVRAERAPDGRV